MAKDISYDEYHQSLSKLIGKPIKDVVGYLTNGQFGFVVFSIQHIAFEDGTSLGVGGEHEIAFVYKEELVKVLGDETLQEIFCEYEPRDCEDEEGED